jgi:formylglycine-generating enzyme required for sulfatase activity
MKRFIITLASITMLVSPCFAMQGDIDNSGKIELRDAVLGLQVTAQLRNAADLAYTGNIGLAEVIYDLRVLAGIGDYVNSLGMTFKLILAGTFTMGSPDGTNGAVAELGRDSSETQHQVMLTKSYQMQTTEVTQGQWKTVMGSNPSYLPACGDNCPVEQVSWNDIQTFVTNMNQRGEGTYRLPTEAEWEYAARAGSATAFANGGITNTGSSPVDPNLNLIGWYWGNSTVTYSPNFGGQGTHPVQGKQANAWGLFDMSGNVWEWVQDLYGAYPTGAVADPTGPSTGSSRVLRGGSWYDPAQKCRSASRNSASPGYVNNLNGFRLVRSQ